MLGQNLAGTRQQKSEKKIDASNVASLAPVWTFTAADEGGTGSFQTTPVVAEGCVYMTTGSGHIYALNADNGAVVWKGRYAKTVAGVCCGSTLFAPTVQDGVLYQYVARNPATAGRKKGPYALAIDAHNGKVIWKSDPVAIEPGAYTNASTVLYEGLLFFGISGAEGGNQNAGGYAILDAETGKILLREHTIPKELVKDGFGGGSIWSTAAVDTKTGYAYAGTGQPTNPNREHHRVNAILKIDLNRNRKTFGQIVDSYKATPDSKTHNTPQCQQGPPEAAQVTCTYTDVDFGASPNLLEDSYGRQIVVEYQKAGVLHAAYTDTMSKAWEATLSAIGAPGGNYSTSATDGKSVFALGTFPGQLFSVNRDFGYYQWLTPVPTALGANPTSVANGLVYHADGKGFLNVFEAESGTSLVNLPLTVRSQQVDAGGGACINSGGGVAIARNTVYAVCGERGVVFGPSDVETGWVIAYRLP